MDSLVSSSVSLEKGFFSPLFSKNILVYLLALKSALGIYVGISNFPLGKRDLIGGMLFLI